MTIHILVNGAFGKMGAMTVQAIEHDSELTLVGKSGKKTHLAELIQTTQPDVVVDFTAPDVAFHNACTIIEAGKRAVIGTTGFTLDEIDQLKTRCAEQQLGSIIAPNFAIGVILLMRFAKEASRYFPQAEIIEFHHDAKLDAPSGTALKTAEMMAENRVTCPEKKPVKENFQGSRGANYQGIPIHAIRLPSLVAHQAVLFGGTGEVLTLKHDAMDRQCFMPGVVLACKKVMQLNQLIYGLENLL